MPSPAGLPNLDGSDFVQCSQCSQPRFFKGQRGLNVHIGKVHKQPPLNALSGPSAPPVSAYTNLQHSEPFHLRLSKLKASTPLVKRIPRGARILVAQNLSEKIKTVLNQNSSESWEQLLSFPYNVLHADLENSKISLTSSIKNNCCSSTDNTRTNFPSHISRSTVSPKLTQSHDIFKKVENKVGDGDLKGAAQLLFSSDIIAPDTPDTLAALIEKHPPSNPPIPLSPNSQCSLNVSEKDILTAVMSFKNGSAGGLDGLTPQHIKDLVCGTTGDVGRILLHDITALINLMLSGNVCSDVTAILYGANLCALKKKDGGIRPIAVGCTYRRLASKVSCKHIVTKLTDTFQPIQLGFGSKGGCEAAVHALRTYINHNQGEVVLKVDVKNAFNSVSRTSILTEIQNYAPEIYDYLWQCYGSESKLMYRDHVINSSTGCQQGDPLGPAIFSLAIHPIISSLASKFNVWYLDDGTLGGDANTVLQDLEKLTKEFQSIGLALNFSKCELFFLDSVSLEKKNEIEQNFNQIAPNIKIVDKQSLRLLGAPVLEDSFQAFIDEQQSKFQENSFRLHKIHSHVACHIIRFCLFVPKFTYVLRSSHLWAHISLLYVLDNLLKNVLSQILNCAFTDESWAQATLPIRFGGLGIRKISSVALPAFLSSVYSTARLYGKIINCSLGNVPVLGMDRARDAWRAECPGEDLPKNPCVQKQWDEPINQNILSNLINNANDSDRARLLASSTHESGYWLNALPSVNIGTFLDNLSFNIAIGLRLGTSLNEPHRCPCGSEVDKRGHHGLSCRRSAGRFSRHAALNDVIRRALATVHVPAILEPNGIARDDGKRPDGMTLIPWSRGRSLVWDATCVDTLASSHVAKTSRAAGAAAEEAECLKRRKYASLTDGYIFLPFAVETLGPWGKDAMVLFRELSRRLIETTGDQKAGSYLGQRISLAIQRGNVASFLGTLPAGGDLKDVFYL